MSLTDATDLATILGATIAVVAFLKGAIEYSHQGAQRRAEYFTALRLRFKDDPSFRELCDFLESDDSKLLEIAFSQKRELLGIFEEVALMLNSRLIRPSVAHYMFGYYAILCFKSRNFWSNVNRETVYWALFNDFARRMIEIEAEFVFNRRNLRF